MIQYGVAVLAKDMFILHELRLVLDHPGCSESINSALLDHQRGSHVARDLARLRADDLIIPVATRVTMPTS